MADVKVDIADETLPSYEAAPAQPSTVILMTERRRPVFPMFLLASILLMMAYHYPPNMNDYWSGNSAMQGCLAPFTPPDATGMFREQRTKLATQFKSSSQVGQNEWVLALGNAQDERTNSDTDILFRQDSNFLYMTGYNVPDTSFLFSLDSGESVMLMRSKSRSEIIFDGGVDDFNAIKAQTDSDTVIYDDDLASFLNGKTVSKIHVVSTSAALSRFPELSGYTLDGSRLLSYLFFVRQVKTERELQLLRISSDVTSRAHESIMRAVRPSGWTESDLESRFLFECYNCGLRFQSYIGIFGTGKNGAVLHYVKNDSPVNNGDMILVDAAGEYRGYTSDVTRTFPSNGFFTPSQRAIYNTVLEAQEASIALCAPGISWSTITSTANRKLVEGLLAANVLQGGNVDELLSAGVLSTFYPHGLGHPVGLDVHDPTPSPWILAYNQVFTIEPGIYFVEMLIDEARNNVRTSKYYNFNVIDSFLNFGGVRIEDVIRITEKSYEVITNAPKQIADIEAWMAGGDFVPTVQSNTYEVPEPVSDASLAVGSSDATVPI